MGPTIFSESISPFLGRHSLNVSDDFYDLYDMTFMTFMTLMTFDDFDDSYDSDDFYDFDDFDVQNQTRINK